MKKITFLFLVLISTFGFAQEKGKVRVSLDLGYAIPSAGGGGLAVYLEPAYNISDNISVGLRLGSAALIKEVVSTEGGDAIEGEIGANGSYMGTFNYYFNGDSSFTPYIGAGLGFVSVANVSFDSSITDDELEADGKFGGMIRAGFELGKFRMGVDYNFIPKTEFEFDGEVIGEAKNGYFGISLGFFVGGGKW